MIVRPVSDIKYFLDNCEQLNHSFGYDCVWHPDQPQKHFKTMPTFVGQMKNVTAHSLPFLLTDNNLLLTDYLWPLLWKTKHKPHKSHGLWKSWADRIEIQQPRIQKHFSEKDTYVWMPIDKQSCNNAWHFWIDVVSRFRLLYMSGKQAPNMILIFPNMGDYMQRAMKEIFPDYRYYVMPENEYWHFDDLIIPSMSNHQDGIITPGLPNWLYTMHAANRQPKRKIFITREDAPARQLSNADELFMTLKGWEKITLANLSISDQIETFSEASHVMSTHGAGLTNTVFAPEGATVIEISQRELIDKKPYPILSMLKKHQHHVILANPVPLSGDKPKNVKRLKDFNNLQVDIKQILEYL